MRRRSIFVAAVCVAGLLMAVPGAGAAAPFQTGAMQVQVWPEQVSGGAVVIASVSLGAAVPLPATVRIPLPEGLSVDWAGEISGADPESDVVRPFTLKKGVGGQYVEFEVSTTREAQVDLSSLPLLVEGDTTRATMEWVQSAPASETLFSVRLPAGTKLIESSPEAFGKPSTNDLGESLYALETQTLKEGDPFKVEVAYRSGAAVEQPASDGNGIIFALVGMLLIAVVVLFVVLARQKARSSEADELSDEQPLE